MLFLFSNILPVEGANRSIIYDLQRENYDFIPNALLRSFKKNKNLFQITTRNKEYLDFLESKDYALKIDKSEISLFPKLSLNWVYPAIISTTIIHFDFFKLKTLTFLSSLLVKNIGVIISNFDQNKIDYINNIIQVENIKKTSIQSFNILILNHKESDEYLEHELKQNPFIKTIIFSKITINEYIKLPNVILCNPNIRLFSEAQNHNTYYNRKLFINENGDFSNTLSSNEVFGNIKKTSVDNLKTILSSIKFQKYWFVHKDLIDVCKQCEFRHMCVDNRIPKQRSDKEWYMETECNYNPYIAKWENEEGYKTLLECGITSNQEGFKINRKKVNAINKELWGD